MRKLLIIFVLLAFAASASAAPIMLEDGEDAGLATNYTLEPDAVDANQVTTDVPVGTGYMNGYYEDGYQGAPSTYTFVFRNTNVQADLSDCRYGAVDLKFQHVAYIGDSPEAFWFSATLRFEGTINAAGDPGYVGIQLDGTDNVGDAGFGGVHLTPLEWHDVHLRLSAGQFVATGSTIDGFELAPSEYTLEVDGATTQAELDYLWGHIDSWSWTGQHASNKGDIKVDEMYITPPEVCGDWWYPEGDINQDCSVDIKDLAIIALAWLECNDTKAPCNYVP